MDHKTSNFMKHDTSLWHKSYNEESFYLQYLPAWKIIAKKQYKAIRPVDGNVLPSMAISTIRMATAS
eukprot:6209036-Ditylum_brightwellii.AAC.1